MGWWRRQPLRTQLVIIVVALGAAALTASGAVAATALRSYLTGQIDQQLMQVSGPDRGGMDPSDPQRMSGIRPTALVRPADDEPPELRPGLPAEFYVAVVTAEGRTQVLSRPYESGAPAAASLATAPPGQLVTVPGSDGRWRAIGRPVPGGTLFYAKSLQAVESTVSRLMLLELAVGLLVLGALALAAFFAVRRSLRPLTDVEQTATAIASGDLSRRVPEHEPTTEVGQLSAAFNSMLDEITETIDQRDAALLESQTSEARMRQFVADASHELRTPLTTIRGYSELYRQGGIPEPKVTETFGRVEGEALRMGTLVDDLLLLARLDQQRPLERREVDVLQVASDVVDGAGASHPDRSVRLKSFGAAVPVVHGDEARLRQVITNLVGNALKYSAGDVRVEVDTRQPGWVRVGVADHGPGIPDDEKARVFERFYRGDPSRTRAAGGTGLGLSIVSAIVTAHGGHVGLRDGDGGPDGDGSGAIVDVWLPAQPEK